MFGPAGVTVGPHSEVHGRNGEPGRIIWNLETPDVKAEFDRLKAAGAIVVVEPYTMEGAPEDTFIATFEDPDGNYFQIATRWTRTRCSGPRAGYSPPVAKNEWADLSEAQIAKRVGRLLGLTFTGGATVGLGGTRSAWPTSATTRSSRSRSSRSTPILPRTCSSSGRGWNATGAASS